MDAVAGKPAAAPSADRVSRRMAGRTAKGRQRPHFSLATLCLLLFLTFLDNTIVSVTLADIQSTFHTGVTGLQWVVSAYALVFASFMLVFGTLSDLIGRKEVMLGGVAVFCAGSVLGALAPNITVLWVARAVMGLGAAASEPGTLSMIRQLYANEEERARALGIWAAISGLALAAGPVLGGLLVGVWNWRAVFWFNAAFGVLGFVAADVVLPENSDAGRGKHLDVLGGILGVATLGLATFAAIDGETAGYGSRRIEALLAGAAVACVLFALVERRARNPLLDLRLFRRGSFAGANVIAFAGYFATFSVFFFVALYLELVGSQSGYRIALDFMPMAAAMILGSCMAGRWVAAAGARMPMTVGCLLAGVGIGLLEIFLRPTSGLSTLGWILPIAGFGFGTVMIPVTSTALTVVAPEHSGMAASATNTARELGAVAGAAILGSIVNGQLTVNLSQRLAAVGIPAAFRGYVITAVETGTISGQAASAEKNKSIAALVAKVTNAAYGSFADGLHISLGIAAGLMVLAGLVALATVRKPAT